MNAELAEVPAPAAAPTLTPLSGAGDRKDDGSDQADHDIDGDASGSPASMR